MSIESWKNELDRKRRALLAQIAKLDASLQRVNLQLAEPDKHFPRAVKEREKYLRKKTRPAGAIEASEILPPKKDLMAQFEEGIKKAEEKKKFDPLDF